MLRHQRSFILGLFVLGIWTALLSSSSFADAPDWSWLDRAERNTKLFDNIQSFSVVCDIAEIDGEHLRDRTIQQWQTWWDSCPENEEEITQEILNKILIPNANRRKYNIDEVESHVQGDRGSARFTGKFLTGTSEIKLSENGYLSVRHVNAAGQAHVVTARLPGYSGSHNWSAPIVDPLDFGTFFAHDNAIQQWKLRWRAGCP